MRQGNETINTNNSVSAIAWALVFLANPRFAQQSKETALAHEPGAGQQHSDTLVLYPGEWLLTHLLTLAEHHAET